MYFKYFAVQLESCVTKILRLGVDSAWSTTEYERPRSILNFGKDWTRSEVPNRVKAQSEYVRLIDLAGKPIYPSESTDSQGMGKQRINGLFELFQGGHSSLR